MSIATADDGPAGTRGGHLTMAIGISYNVMPEAIVWGKSMTSIHVETLRPCLGCPVDHQDPEEVGHT